MSQKNYTIHHYIYLANLYYVKTQALLTIVITVVSLIYVIKPLGALTQILVWRCHDFCDIFMATKSLYPRIGADVRWPFMASMASMALLPLLQSSSLASVSGVIGLVSVVLLFSFLDVEPSKACRGAATLESLELNLPLGDTPPTCCP